MTISIGDIENPNSIIAWWNSNPNNQNGPYLSDVLFDKSYVGADSVDAVFGQDQAYTGLREEGTDADVSFKNNIGFDTDSYSLMFFKNAKLMNETRRSQIQKALFNNQNQGIAKAIANTQMKDAASLLNDAKFTREKLALEAIQTGKIISPSGVRDFHMPSEHLIKTNPWGDPKNSTPVADVKKAVRQMSNDNNTTITTAIMNTNTFWKLSQSKDLLQSIGLGKIADTFAVPDATIKSQFTQLTGVQIAIYDTADFLKDDTVVLIPAGALGRMSWNDTPEALGNLSGSGAQVSTTADGISMVTYRQIDPVGTIVKVSQKVLPTFDKSQNVCVLDVSDGTTAPTDKSSSSQSSSSSKGSGK